MAILYHVKKTHKKVTKNKYVVGIDEVGRGPIAGPVCVAVLRSTQQNLNTLITRAKKEYNLPLRDSKKLSRAQRETWVTLIRAWQKEGKCDVAESLVHAKIIDRVGISKALKIAIARSIYKLKISSKTRILLDGLLYAPSKFTNQKTITKGDEKEPTIALASVIAKVHRDRYMRRLHEKHPEYGFHNHVGYGTKEHYAALMIYGMTFCHRATFVAKLFLK